MISLLCPVLLLCLDAAFRHWHHLFTGPNLAIAALVVAGVSCLLLATGPIMGILGLLLMRPGGRALIVTCSLIGVVWSGVLIGIAVPNFVRARSIAMSQAKAADNVAAAGKDFARQTAASFKTNGPAASLTRVNQALDQAAQSGVGDTALVAKGTQAYVARVQAIQRAYQEASLNLTAAHVLSTSNLVDRDAIQERKAVVQNFLKCNQDLKNFVDRNEDNYRAELERFNVSPSAVASSLQGFHSTSAPQIPVIDQIRADDERIGDSMLAVLDLLDATWGQWSYNQQDGHLRFGSRDQLQQYNTDLREIQRASAEQAVAQKHLAEVMTQLSMR